MFYCFSPHDFYIIKQIKKPKFTVKYPDDLRNLLFEKIIERDRPFMKFDHVKRYFLFSAMLIHISVD